MKRIFTLTIILMAMTACTGLQLETAEPTATIIPQVNMPNPASVYCEQNGNKLEIKTASDDSQSGICVFPDGSTCGEWAFYRGECGPADVEATTEAKSGLACTCTGSASRMSTIELQTFILRANQC